MNLLTTFLSNTSFLLGLYYLVTNKICVTSQTVIPGTFYKVIENGKVTGLQTGTSLSAKSVLHCATRCRKVPGCSVFTYNSVGKQCDLYNWVNVTIIEEPGTRKSWVDTRTLMLNARQQGETGMDLPQAIQLCATLGGALIGAGTIYDARDHADPYDKCRCGWIADTTQRFVISTPNITCNFSNGNTGAKYCYPKYPTVPDAYCEFK